MPSYKKLSKVEMLVFLEVTMAIGIVKLPSISDYWTTGIMQLPWFPSIMFRDRFKELSRFFHLSDSRNNLEKDDTNYSKLYKLGGLEVAVSETFSQMFHPGRNL